MNQTFPTLYKRSTKTQKVLIWWMELEEGVDGHLSKYRTHSGTLDGKITTSGWTEVEGKNIGRANQTTSLEQATAEVESKYAKKTRTAYFKDLESVDQERYFEPMLAKLYKDDIKGGLFKEDGRPKKRMWVSPKLDGIRCVIDRTGMWTREGKEITSCPHIFESAQTLLSDRPELEYLDGELYNHEYHDRFEELVGVIKKVKSAPEDYAKAEKVVEFHMYDFVTNGEDKPTYGIRRARMEGYCLDLIPYFKPVEAEEVTDHLFAEGLHARNKGLGYEGSIIRKDTAYRSGKTANLLKWKDFEDEEFEITRLECGTGNWAGVPKVLFFRNPTSSKEESKATLKGSREECLSLIDRDDLPGQLATIKFFGRTSKGELRFPVVIKIQGEEKW